MDAAAAWAPGGPRSALRRSAKNFPTTSRSPTPSCSRPRPSRRASMSAGRCGARAMAAAIARQAIPRWSAATILPRALRAAAAGFDYHLSRDSVVGVALAGGGTDWSLAQGLGGGKSDAFQAGVYGATRWGPAYLAAALAFTNHWMSTDRFAFAGDHLTANFNAQSFGGRVEG